jgi:predicted nucleic acid-binding protein
VTRFWDSSGIVSLVVRQRHTGTAESLLDDGSRIAAWWATPVECGSALARLFRDGHLGAEDIHAASRRLHEISRHWIEIEPNESLREMAQALVRRHPIRAADALQLAAAMSYSERAAAAPEFVTFDQRVGSAAQHEGFRTRGI